MPGTFDAMMQMGGGGAPPAGGGAGPAGPAGPPGMGGAPPPGAGGPPGMAGAPPGPGGQQTDPREMLQVSLMGFSLAMNQMGMTETGMRVLDMVHKALERMQKSTPQGRNAAGMGGAVPPPQPPGVGPMPGTPTV